jgi:hypothetical protein
MLAVGYRYHFGVMVYRIADWKKRLHRESSIFVTFVSSCEPIQPIGRRARSACAKVPSSR